MPVRLTVFIYEEGVYCLKDATTEILRIKLWQYLQNFMYVSHTDTAEVSSSVPLKYLISVSCLDEAPKLHLLTCYTRTYYQGCTNFPTVWEPSQNSRCRKGDMKKTLYLGHTNIRCHCTKFSCHIDLASRICAAMLIT